MLTVHRRLPLLLLLGCVGLMLATATSAHGRTKEKKIIYKKIFNDGIQGSSTATVKNGATTFEIQFKHSDFAAGSFVVVDYLDEEYGQFEIKKNGKVSANFFVPVAAELGDQVGIRIYDKDEFLVGEELYVIEKG